MEPRISNHSNDMSTNIFLTGAILFANVDYSGLAEYALKAIVGGVVWMGFKLMTDFVSEKMKKKSSPQ